MKLDLRIMTIGFSEPTLWVAVAATGMGGIAAGLALGMRIGRRPPGVTQWAAGLWLGLLLALLIAVNTHVVFSVLFSATTGGAMGCTYIVGPVLLLPAVTAIAAEALAWRLTASRGYHAL
jgi:hypothetical protein